MTINHIHPYTVFWAYMTCGHLPMANRERRCFTNVNIYLKCFEAVRIKRQKRRNHNKSSFRFMKNSSPQKIAPTLCCFIGIFELFQTGILAAAWKYFRLISAFCSQPACFMNRWLGYEKITPHKLCRNFTSQIPMIPKCYWNGKIRKGVLLQRFRNKHPLAMKLSPWLRQLRNPCPHRGVLTRARNWASCFWSVAGMARGWTFPDPMWKCALRVRLVAFPGNKIV